MAPGIKLGIAVMTAMLLLMVVLAAIIVRNLFVLEGAVVLLLLMVILGGAWALLDERALQRQYEEDLKNVRDPE